MLHAMFRTLMSDYIGIPTIRVSGATVSTVPTADSVVTGKVNCFNFIVLLHSPPWFVETMSRDLRG